MRIVAAPTVDADVRFDLNGRDLDDVDSIVRAADWSLGTPELRGDPDSFGADYGPRTITVSLRVQGDRRAVLRRQSAIARQLLRTAPQGWLQFQLDADADPVWFRLYRPRPGELDFSLVNVAGRDTPDMWRLSMTLLAEPFAYGARETLPAVRVLNDPSKESGCRVMLPAVRGDAPSPVRVEARVFSANGGGTSFGKRSLLAVAACQRVRTPLVLTGFTTIGGSIVTDSRYVGGQALAWSDPDRTQTLRSRGYIEAQVPVGSYRVLARVTDVDAPVSAAATMQIRQGLTGGVEGPEVRLWRGNLNPVGKTVYVDLGVQQFPAKTMLPADVAGSAAAPAKALVTLTLRASINGAGTMAVDALLLLPVDTCPDGAWSALQIHDGPAGTQTWVVDGDVETLWQRDTFGVITGTDASTHGLHPQVTPGVGNTLLWMPLVHDDPVGFDASNYSDTLTDYTELIISYHPRWLWIGDGGETDL